MYNTTITALLFTIIPFISNAGEFIKCQNQIFRGNAETTYEYADNIESFSLNEKVDMVRYCVEIDTDLNNSGSDLYFLLEIVDRIDDRAKNLRSYPNLPISAID